MAHTEEGARTGVLLRLAHGMLASAGARVAPVARGAVRPARVILALLIGLHTARPVEVSAQATPPASARTPRTHVVAEGETLWSLAARYLGDGHRWEEIVALNRDVISSARRLPAGTRLVLPGGAIDALPIKVANGVAALPREGSAEEDLYARYAGRTVFFGTPRPSSAVGSAAPEAAIGRRVTGTEDGATARERLAAPWLDGESRIAHAGRVAHRLDVPAVSGSGGERELHLYDRVAVVAPDGAPATPGREYLAVAPGDTIDGHGRVVIPTGVIRVLRADSARGTSVGVIVAKFGAMEEGALVVPNPVEPQGVGGDTTAEAPRDAVARGAVIAVVDGAVLPTLQHTVLLDVGARLGVRAGDRVTFFRDVAARDRSDASGEVARGIVMRVSSAGASALIVQQSQPALGEGTPVRVARPLP